jgi:hypothetical protein
MFKLEQALEARNEWREIYFEKSFRMEITPTFAANVVVNKSYFNDNFGSGYTLKALHLICCGMMREKRVLLENDVLLSCKSRQ